MLCTLLQTGFSGSAIGVTVTEGATGADGDDAAEKKPPAFTGKGRALGKK